MNGCEIRLSGAHLSLILDSLYKLQKESHSFGGVFVDKPKPLQVPPSVGLNKFDNFDLN